jgi:hypothetical protein
MRVYMRLYICVCGCENGKKKSGGYRLHRGCIAGCSRGYIHLGGNVADRMRVLSTWEHLCVGGGGGVHPGKMENYFLPTFKRYHIADGAAEG